MKNWKRRLLAVLCATVTATGIAAPAMTPVYAAQGEATDEGNPSDGADDAGNKENLKRFKKYA